MAATSIEWADHSINPIRAQLGPSMSGQPNDKRGHYCEKISPGCAKCYASTLQRRFRMPLFPGVTGDGDTVRLDGVTKTGVSPYFDESVLAQVRKRRKPTRYFVCDMTDAFGWWVPDEWLDAMFATFAECPQHTFMMLTKRPARMRDYVADDPIQRCYMIDKAAEQHGGLPTMPGPLGPTSSFQWPLPNVWLGVSAENQKCWNERVDVLETIPAAVRFVSVEPMLEEIAFGFECPECDGGGMILCGDGGAHHEIRCETCRGEGFDYHNPRVDWVIFGGESGHGARPCNVEWIRDGLAQCKADGVAAFVKQLGKMPFESRGKPVIYQTAAGAVPGHADSQWLNLQHSKGGDPAEWPADLRVREFPQVSR